MGQFPNAGCRVLLLSFGDTSLYIHEVSDGSSSKGGVRKLQRVRPLARNLAKAVDVQLSDEGV